VPAEYAEFLLCCRLGCMPQQLRDMPEEDYRMLTGFLRVEGEAARLEAFRAQHG
jgi:hypothetical protein